MPYDRWGILTGANEYGLGGQGIWADKANRSSLNDLQGALGAVLKNAGISWDDGNYGAVQDWKAKHAGQWQQMLNTYLGGNSAMIDRLKVAAAAGPPGGNTVDPPAQGGGQGPPPPQPPGQDGDATGFDNYKDENFLNSWKGVNEMLNTLDPAEAKRLRDESKKLPAGQGNRLNFLREQLLKMGKTPAGNKMKWTGKTAPPPGTNPPPPPGGGPPGGAAAGGGPQIDADVRALNDRIARERAGGGGVGVPNPRPGDPMSGGSGVPGGGIEMDPQTPIGRTLEDYGVRPQQGGVPNSEGYPYNIPPAGAGDPTQPAGVSPKKKKILGQTYS